MRTLIEVELHYLSPEPKSRAKGNGHFGNHGERPVHLTTPVEGPYFVVNKSKGEKKKVRFQEDEKEGDGRRDLSIKDHALGDGCEPTMKLKVFQNECEEKTNSVAPETIHSGLEVELAAKRNAVFAHLEAALRTSSDR